MKNPLSVVWEPLPFFASTLKNATDKNREIWHLNWRNFNTLTILFLLFFPGYHCSYFVCSTITITRQSQGIHCFIPLSFSLPSSLKLPNYDRPLYSVVIDSSASLFCLPIPVSPLFPFPPIKSDFYDIACGVHESNLIGGKRREKRAVNFYRRILIYVT